MESDSTHTERSDASITSARELARYWVQSQSVISAYITANVIDLHHAEDLVQEVAQIVAEKFEEYDRQRSFVSWALGIARNRVLKYYRSRARDRLILGEAALQKIEDALITVEPEVEERRIALRQCLEQIRGRRKEVLEMRYGQNAKIPDIGRHFSMSVDGVFVMLHRIRVALLECIRRQLAEEGTH